MTDEKKTIPIPARTFSINVKKYIKDISELREEIIHINHEYEGKVTVHIFAFNMDIILRHIFDEMLISLNQRHQQRLKSELSVVALGGYGRGELNIYSDIDLLFLTDDKPECETMEFITKACANLWDCKLDLGQCVRTVEQCLDCVGSDLKSASSFLQTRFIWGNKILYKNFKNRFMQKIRNEGRQWWVRERLDVMKARRMKYGESVYLMEPNIKESEGGLRDIEFIRWTKEILKGTKNIKDIERRYIINKDNYNRLNEALSFILRLRNELHALENKKTDVLSYERQIKIARRLKYKKAKHFFPEELLMNEYFGYAKFVDKMCNQSIRYLEANLRHLFKDKEQLKTTQNIKIPPFFHIVDGYLQIEKKGRKKIRKQPRLLLLVFIEAAKNNVLLSEGAKEIISQNLRFIDDEYRSSQETKDLFLKFLSIIPGVYMLLEDMHECGFLNSLMPEFKRITCLVRVDFYHRYTTDEHSLMAVKECEKLLCEKRNDNPVSKVASEIKQPQLLILAILLHDIGKGEGHGHVMRGAQIVQRITSRMDMNPDEQNLIRKLVLYHLRLAHVSQRRNLDDPDVIKAVADEIQDLELLKMLYVLTYCDMMAVSPDAWNDWKGNLLYELYSKTGFVLEGKNIEEKLAYSMPENLENDMMENLHDSAGTYKRSDVAHFINSAPLKYLASNSSKVLAEHFKMLKSLNENNRVIWEIAQVDGARYSEIVICGYDEPGFFNKICAALSSKDINILSAQIFSTKDGYCIDVFQVTNLDNEPLPKDMSLERVRQILNSVLKNEQQITIFTEKSPKKYMNKFIPARSMQLPIQVVFNNSISKTHTVIEIKATDKPWLLYKITSALASENLNIDISLITTEAYRVVDVFYVTDLDSNKILDKSQIAKIEKKLRDSIDEA